MIYDNIPYSIEMEVKPIKGLMPGDYTLTIGTRYGSVSYSKVIDLVVKVTLIMNLFKQYSQKVEIPNPDHNQTQLMSSRNLGYIFDANKFLELS